MGHSIAGVLAVSCASIWVVSIEAGRIGFVRGRGSDGGSTSDGRLDGRSCQGIDTLDLNGGAALVVLAAKAASTTTLAATELMQALIFSASCPDIAPQHPRLAVGLAKRVYTLSAKWIKISNRSDFSDNGDSQ
jgi:hypothetical protein